MLNTKVKARIFILFAELLEYPSSLITERTAECVRLVAPFSNKAAGSLKEFQQFLAETPQCLVEEIYTSTFDLQAICWPYAGYHLFSDNRQRGAFLVKLKEIYRHYDFTLGNEMPDHLAVIMRFLSSIDNDDEINVIINDCLRPVLDKLLPVLKEKDNCYYKVFRALSLLLEESHGDLVDDERRKEA